MRSRFPILPEDFRERPLKVHFYRDQHGASYRSMGKTRPYANTACKHNWPVENITEDRSKVTCRRCLKVMAKADREATANDQLPPDSASDFHDLEEWLDAERQMADKMAQLARYLLDQIGDNEHAVEIVSAQITVGDIARGQLALYDEHKDSRKGRWNEPPLD